MPGPDLRSFVDRSRGLLDAAPPTTGRETRTWLVEPFLETLGWDARASADADAVALETTVEETRLEYVLGVDSVPALFVAVEPYDESLAEPRARSVLEAMAWTGVDRAIYTNGREFLFLAGARDVERLACRLPALPDHKSSIEHFSRGALCRQLDPDSEPAVARQLAVRQGTLVDAFVDQLTTAASDAYAEAFEAAAERFCERLVVSFAETDADRFDSSSDDISFRFTDPTASDSALEPESKPKPDSSDRSDPESTEEHERPSERSAQSAPARADESAAPEPTEPTEATENREQDGDLEAFDDALESATRATQPENEVPAPEEGAADASAADTGSGGDDDENADGTEDRNRDQDGEYVARFFNERGSIGAIGHSSSRRALVGVAEYLLDRGLSGVSVPWSPDDDEAPTLLNADPVRADGEPMAMPRELSNGLYLETGGDATTHAQVAQALAARAGLRVMLTGDWK